MPLNGTLDEILQKCYNNVMNARTVFFTNSLARLAFQVDRKILQCEEEVYLRLDLLAHEGALSPKNGNSTQGLSWDPKIPKKLWNPFKQFVLTATGIYVVLFLITNAEAYSKIALASIEDWNAEREAALEIVVPGPLSNDPWTGEKHAKHLEPEQNLMVFGAESPLEETLPALNLFLTSYEDRVSIPSLNINAPLIEPKLGVESLRAKDWSSLESQIRDSLSQGVVHYPGTAQPGKGGNVFLTAHSSNYFWESSDYNTVFALLPKIEPGAEVTITHQQKEFHYRVLGKKEVSPDDVSILKQGNEKLLTLMTCTPVGTSLKRLVVTAELIP